MQTLYAAKNRLFPRVRRWAAAVAAIVSAAALCACDPPRIEGRAEAERRLNPCEQALYTALDADRTIATAKPVMLAHAELTTSRDAWLDVAVYCPSRFGEGVTHAARAQVRAEAVYGTDAVDAGWSVNGVTTLDSDADADALDGLVDLSAAALAEDKAGFAFEVLAARGAPGATLELSDRSKAAAQKLAAMSGDDSRQAVYAVDELTVHPDTTVDSATGLKAPTASVVLMDCARSLVGAVAEGTELPTGADAESAQSGDVGMTRTDGASGTQRNGSDGTPAGGTDADRTVERVWRAYAVQAANHTAQAFRLGYPMIDEALFEAEDTAKD